MPIQRAATSLSDADAAARELFEQLDPDGALAIVFTSPDYDLAALGSALDDRFDGTVIGCTSSGNIAPNGFSQHGVVGMALDRDTTKVRSWGIDMNDVAAGIEALAADIEANPPGGSEIFGLLLVDGLCRKEEQLVADLYANLGDIPVLGASAGDFLEFESTSVLHRGEFRENIAVFTLIETERPIELFQLQHHTPTDQMLVVTKADATRRFVYEFNGLPAAEAYAEVLGVEPDELTPELFSRHPVMMKAGDDYYIRSIQQIEPDGIQFYCAIDTGIVLRVGTPQDRRETLFNGFQRASERVGGAEAILTLDCILRRLEFEEDAMTSEVGEVFQEFGALGFSTYGEQFNALHMNQTLVGVAIGPRP